MKKQMDKVSTVASMEHIMLENGKMINSMVLVRKNGQMEQFMKDSMKKG